MSNSFAADYHFPTAEGDHTSAYLWRPVVEYLESQNGKRVFELGCGNGAFARHLKKLGYQVRGVDPSEQGIAQAKAADPDLAVEIGNAYEPLAERHGKYSVVVSLEVVPCVYYPKKYARCVAELLEPGGIAIISTPYHSYFKNLVLALTGRMDSHFNALWDNGPIKFWSVDTLTSLFAEAGLRREGVLRVGRVPILAKSMILVFRR